MFHLKNGLMYLFSENSSAKSPFSAGVTYGISYNMVSSNEKLFLSNLSNRPL
jgi:hypothetical protein